MHRLERKRTRLMAAPYDARTLVVAATSDADGGAAMPSAFRIGGAAPPDAQALDPGRSALTADETDDTVRWLLATGAHVIADDLAAAIHEEVEASLRGMRDGEPVAEAVEETDRDLGALDAACIIANTPYNPGFWNTPSVQPKNNCYNYAALSPQRVVLGSHAARARPGSWPPAARAWRGVPPGRYAILNSTVIPPTICPPRASRCTRSNTRT